MLGAANVFAGPAIGLHDAREAVRAYHIQSITLERNLPQEPQPGQPQQERSRRGSGTAESSGYGSSGDGQANRQSDGQRRQGRMTPEERRALRRQIDEASQDIYSPATKR